MRDATAAKKRENAMTRAPDLKRAIARIGLSLCLAAASLLGIVLPRQAAAGDIPNVYTGEVAGKRIQKFRLSSDALP
jgi:hypothetical protein